MKVAIQPLHLQDVSGSQRPLESMTRSEWALCLDILARIIHSNDAVEVLRPDENSFSIAEIQAFRSRQYKEISPYLDSDFQQQIETSLALDSRSHHFTAVHKGEIVGSLRVTPPPYELSALTGELSSSVASMASETWEISRFVVEKTMASSFVGEKLLFAAARWLCHHTEMTDLLMICKSHRKRYFEYYGLTPYQDRLFTIPHRNNGDYYLMHGNFAKIIDCAFSTLYVNPQEAEKRHRWTHKKA